MTAPDKPDWKALAEALELYDNKAFVIRELSPPLDVLWHAAHYALQHGPAIDNAETVWWCETHDGQGTRGLSDITFCWKTLDNRWRRSADCRMVEKRLLPQIGEGE